MLKACEILLRNIFWVLVIKMNTGVIVFFWRQVDPNRITALFSRQDFPHESTMRAVIRNLLFPPRPVLSLLNALNLLRPPKLSPTPAWTTGDDKAIRFLTYRTMPEMTALQLHSPLQVLIGIWLVLNPGRHDGSIHLHKNLPNPGT